MDADADATYSLINLFRLPGSPTQAPASHFALGPKDEDGSEDEDSTNEPSIFDKTVMTLILAKMEEVNAKNVWLSRTHIQVVKDLNSVLKNLEKANELLINSRFRALRHLLHRTLRTFRETTTNLVKIRQTYQRLGYLLTWIQDYVQLEGEGGGDDRINAVVNAKEMQKCVGTIATKLLDLLGDILGRIDAVHAALGE